MNETPESRLDPRAEYVRRRDRWARRAADCCRHENRIAAGRLAAFTLFLVAAWFAWRGGALPAAAWMAPLAAFAVLAGWHGQVISRRRRAERAVDWYRAGLDRLDGRVPVAAEPGNCYQHSDHPYALDLDLFGDRSVFQRLCTARTRAGERCLAEWLQAGASAAEVRRRHRAVEELRNRLDLREDLALLGDEVRAGVHPEALAEWGETAPILAGNAIRVVLAMLAALSLTAAVGGMFFGWGWRPFGALLLLQGLAVLPLRGRVRRVIAAVEQPCQDLDLLARILARLEREPFRDERLAGLQRELATAGVSPARRIARLHRWIELLDSRRNQLFGPFAIVLLWSTQIAFAIEAWRRMSGAAVRRWLEAVGEIEALASLAVYAFENPDDPFPEIDETGVRFEAEAIGHPMLPADRCVRNDLRLDGSTRLFIVSGSNMSGKSTLLRSIGVNAVLALAGAPVRARRLAMTPMAVGATIRVVDSLQEGSSRFYTEITRLRQLQEIAAGPTPLLFLLDEILHGTNSHDRRIGAAAVVREFLERGAIGLVTTHDLALTEMAEAMPGGADNIHFEDRFEDGRIRFDYRIRPGVVRRSNALALMRSIGLQVGD